MKNSPKTRIFLKGLVCDLFVLILQFGNMNQVYAGPYKKLLESVDRPKRVEFSDQQILKESQISYRAEGGFSGVKSYGVILSCVNGHVSVLKSIHDPRMPGDRGNLREIKTISKEEYLALWDRMDRQAVFEMKDGPAPRCDIQDEFTVQFNAKVGSHFHQFEIYGISRPEAARYFAIRRLIDDSVQMAESWAAYEMSAQRAHLSQKVAEKAN